VLDPAIDDDSALLPILLNSSDNKEDIDEEDGIVLPPLEDDFGDFLLDAVDWF
jgi:hypothetical protein